MQNIPQLYTVVIPQGIYSGDSFIIRLPLPNQQFITLICPEGYKCGDILELKVYSNISQQKIKTNIDTTSTTQYEIQHSSWNHSPTTIILWIILDIILLGILIAAITIPIYSIQIISKNCNPLLPNKLYYNLWKGIGTTPNCIHNETQFCIKWSNYNAFHFIDQITNASMVYDINLIIWTQSLFIISTIISFLILVYHSIVLIMLTTSNYFVLFIHFSFYFLLFSFLFAK